MPAPVVLMGILRRRVVFRAIIAGASALAIACGMFICAGVALLAAGSTGNASVCVPAVTAAETLPNDATGLRISVDGQLPTWLTSAQLAVAGSYVSVGRELGVPKEGLVVAIMMSLQESGLRVLANTNVPSSLSFPHEGVGHDHDSLGTAQQRPAAGWGTIAQLMDPIYNARAFYGGPTGPNLGSPRGLLDIGGWRSMDKGQAAQAVQVSAFPELYARWEPDAEAIVRVLEGTSPPPKCLEGEPTAALPAGTDDLSQIRLEILRFTREGLGGAYVWGGTAFKAWDCSGYVQWIYRQAGIELPRVEQWRVGTRTNNPQPGDLVVQNPQGPDNWGHVGIYAGEGMMYSALNPSVGTLLHPVDWNPGAAYFDLLR
ncbi:C40 family peptidase [Arthrobacter sp. efr-133-TYG-120]|uniref:C40 family peptidase n=1 Tax=Arthrobacter sp. efr-133-TYG-120 TaxID=3040280 RepID=UPI00254EA0D0|nr:C40 family peptidase [Arthrobacter sp. efr-133-TYG-120]